jgi:hypothetical protein
MRVREAERLENALHRAAQGKAIEGTQIPLVRTAQRVSALGEPYLPPPQGLMPGRHQFLAEAARLRAKRATRTRWTPAMGVPRLAGALVVLILIVGLLFGTGAVAAASLPGEPLYGLKLAGEEIRLALTKAPRARAALHQTLAGERLDEIAALVQQNKDVDAGTAGRAVHQLAAALDAALQIEEPEVVPALQRLEAMIQQRQQTMAAFMGEMPEPAKAPMRQLVQAMEQVRQEAHLGQGDPAGVRQRRQHGTPPDVMDLPSPSQTPPATDAAEPGSMHTAQPTDTARPGPSHTTQPTDAAGPGPSHTTQPTDAAKPGPSHTAQPTDAWGPGATPHPKGTSTRPPTAMPGMEPTHAPGPGSGGRGTGKP